MLQENPVRYQNNLLEFHMRNNINTNLFPMVFKTKILYWQGGERDSTFHTFLRFQISNNNIYVICTMTKFSFNTRCLSALDAPFI